MPAVPSLMPPFGTLPDGDPVARALADAVPTSLPDLPMILCLSAGNAASPAVGALAIGAAQPPAPGDLAAWWRWWVAEDVIAVEASPSLLCHDADRTAWSRLEACLAILHQIRPRRPLDGIVLLSDIAALATSGDEGRRIGRRCRRILLEAQVTFGWDLPVFLVGCGLEALPGWSILADALPHREGDQALGIRLADTGDPRLLLAQTNTFMAELAQHLRAWCIAVSVREGVAARPDALALADRVAAAGPAMEATIKALLAPDADGRHARLRGTYLGGVGGRRHGLADLGRRILPEDTATPKAAPPAVRRGRANEKLVSEPAS